MKNLIRGGFDIKPFTYLNIYLYVQYEPMDELYHEHCYQRQMRFVRLLRHLELCYQRGKQAQGKSFLRMPYTTNYNKRSDKPFVAVHCVILQKTLLKSELFGNGKGVFTRADSRKVWLFKRQTRRHYPTVDYYTRSISLNVSEMVIGYTIIIPSASKIYWRR